VTSRLWRDIVSILQALATAVLMLLTVELTGIARQLLAMAITGGSK